MGTIMADQNLDYAAIRNSVEKGIQRQKWNYRIAFFVAHLLFFVIAMLAVWLTLTNDTQLSDFLFDSGRSAIVIVPATLWATVLLFHVASLYFETRMGEKAIREQVLMREVGEDILRRAIEDDGVSEKPKRHGTRLSDDGELIDEDERIEQGDYNVRRAGSS
jgi:hypothetical protein